MGEAFVLQVVLKLVKKHEELWRCLGNIRGTITLFHYFYFFSRLASQWLLLGNLYMFYHLNLSHMLNAYIYTYLVQQKHHLKFCRAFFKKKKKRRNNQHIPPATDRIENFPASILSSVLVKSKNPAHFSAIPWDWYWIPMNACAVPRFPLIFIMGFSGVGKEYSCLKPDNNQRA